MRNIFYDAALNEQFEQAGYVIVPMLDQAEAAGLMEIYRRLKPAAASGFHATMFSADLKQRREVDEQIKRVLGPKVARWIKGYRACSGNFVVKESEDPGGAVPVHQDWTFVDERVYRSINVWCALTDVNAENGAVSVLKGSHRLIDRLIETLRGPFFPNPFSDLDQAIRRSFLTELPVRMGEAILYDHQLVHCSPPNRTTQTRIVANLSIAPSEAQLLHCRLSCPDSVSEVEIFEVEEDFFPRCSMNERPAGVRSLGLFHYRPPKLTEADLADLYNAAPGRREMQFPQTRKEIVRSCPI